MNDVEELYQRVKKNIRRIRKEKKITQKELARSIGVSKGYISDIERAKLSKHPSIYVLIKISNRLNIDIVDLFKEEY